MIVRSISVRAGILLGFALLFLLAPMAVARDRARAAKEVQIAAAQKDTIQQIKHLEAAIRADDTYAPAYVLYAKEKTEHEHDSDAAIDYMKKALQYATPGEPLVKEARHTLIEFYIQDQKYKDAEVLLEKAASNKKDEWALSRLGYVYQMEGDNDKARPVLQDALELNPSDLQAHLSLGDVYRATKEPQKAVDEYQKVLDHATKGSDLYTAASHHATDVKNQLLMKKVIFGAEIAGGVIVVLMLLMGVASMLRGRRSSVPRAAPPRARTGDVNRTLAVPTLPSSPTLSDAGSAEELLQSTVSALARLTSMSEGVAYSATFEQDALIPQAALNLEMDELSRQAVDAERLRTWHERMDGAPFMFSQEKREDSFIQAFGDLKEQMEEREMKLGVPLTFNGSLMGLVFLGLGKDAANDEKLKLKKQFEKNQAAMRKIADEAGGALSNLLDSEQAYTDPVTRFHTSNYVDENLPDFLNRAQRASNFCIGIMLEYDSYQQIQDQYGDSQSTTVLKLLAGDVRRILNEDEDMIARLDGGLFVAFTQHADEGHATRIANRLLEQIKSMKISRTLPAPSASLGVAIYPTHADSAGELVTCMRDALAQSSAQGGGAVTVLPIPGAEPAPPPPPPPPVAARTPSSGALGASRAPASGSGTLPRAGASGTLPPAGPPSGTLQPPPPRSPASGPLAPSPFARPGPPAGGAPSPFGRPPGAAPAASPFGRPAATPSSEAANSPFARATPPPPPEPPPALVSPPTPALANPAAPSPAPSQSPFSSPASETGSNKSPASPFVPGRPAASPFVPGRPAGAASPFIPGRPAQGAASPFVPGRPASPDTEPGGASTVESTSPFAAPKANAAPATPAPPPPPYVPSRRGPASQTRMESAEIPGRQSPASQSRMAGAEVPGRAPAPAPFPPAPPPANHRAAPGGGFPAPPAPAAGAPAPPPFVPSRRPEPVRRLSAASAPQTAALVSSPAVDKSGYQPRTTFESMLVSAVESARGAQEELSLVYIALDSFGVIDDKGTELVNQTIASVTGMVKSLLNEEEDVPGVWDTNGFAIIKPRTDSEGGMNFAEWVRVTVSHLSFPELSNPVSVSLGVATFPHDAGDAHTLVQRAKEACDEAARAGGNRSLQSGTY